MSLGLDPNLVLGPTRCCSDFMGLDLTWQPNPVFSRPGLKSSWATPPRFLLVAATPVKRMYLSHEGRIYIPSCISTIGSGHAWRSVQRWFCPLSGKFTWLRHAFLFFFYFFNKLNLLTQFKIIIIAAKPQRNWWLACTQVEQVTSELKKHFSLVKEVLLLKFIR